MISWLSIELFEGVAEGNHVVVVALRGLQICNQFLSLIQHVVYDHLTLDQRLLGCLEGWLLFNAEQIVAEGWDHEELLEDAIHVADVLQVHKTDILLIRAGSGGWPEAEALWLVDLTD